MDGDRKTLSRREFLRESAAAAAAFSMGVAAPARAAEETKPADREPILYGFVGTGNQGRRLLSRAVRVPGTRVVALCDIYPPNLEEGMKIAKDVRTYQDYREMLEKERDLDAVLVATPLHWHAPITIDALRAGKHVFCEKTLARTVEECKEIVRASRETGKFVQVGHQRRYNPLYEHALKLIKKDGVLGRITHIRALWHRNGSWRRAVPEEMPPGTNLALWGYEDLEHLINWRLYRKSSGGLMTELASHQLDVVNWFLEATPLSVMGLGGIDYWEDGREVYDNVSVLYEYPNGVKVVYTSITTNAYDDYYEQFMGDEGTLLLTKETQGLLFREVRAEKLAWERFAHKDKSRGKEGIVLDAQATPDKKKRRGRGAGKQVGGKEAQKDPFYPYYLELEDFFACVREGRKPFCDAEAAMRSAVTVLMANEAIKRDTKIEFTEDLFAV